MANQLTAWQVRHLGEFVEALNKLSRDHHVNVCAHGPITIEVGDGVYVELARNFGDPEAFRDYRVEVTR